MEIKDLTYQLDENAPVYPGDEKLKLFSITTVEQQGYNMVGLNTNMHVGTHVEVSNHMQNNSKKICNYSLDRFFLDACFYGQGYKDAVIVEKKIRSLTDYDYMTIEEAKDLIEHNVKMVILNTQSPDSYPYDIHKLLFKNDIVIVENATNLDLIREWTNFKIIAFPLKIETEASLIRLVAIKD